MDGSPTNAKRAALLEILEQRGARSLTLSSTTALGWYLDGARVHIELSAGPVLTVRVSADGDVVNTGSNEAARLLAEELPGDLVVRPRPWYAPLDDAARDVSLDLLETDVADELRALRRSLSPLEIDRFRALGADAATALTEALSAATPATTGFELAASLTGAVVSRGADALVVLVDGADRVALRHPLPTTGAIGRRAMLVVCARRHGLIANATRWVRFGAPTAEEQDADERILEVEADAFAATRPGATIGGVLATIRSSYPRHGFNPDEWLSHHQGGPAGYATRDGLAVPDAQETVALHQAFAWNPTGPGCKVEDTVRTTVDGVEVLTVDPRWPTTLVRGIRRPVVLEL